MKIPYCTGCGEYPGDFVADEIETLRARLAAADRMAEEIRKYQFGVRSFVDVVKAVQAYRKETGQ